MHRRRGWMWWSKWLGVACCVAILIAFALSSQWAFGWRSPSGQHSFSLRFGTGGYTRYAQSFAGLGVLDSGWNVKRYGGLWPNWRCAGFELRLPPGSSGITGVTTPLWMPFLVVGIPTTVMFFLDRRRIPPNHCRKCGYNLTGNVSGVCPECGTKRAHSAAAADTSGAD